MFLPQFTFLTINFTFVAVYKLWEQEMIQFFEFVINFENLISYLYFICCVL